MPKKFPLTEEQVAQVAEIIKTPHFILIAQNPKTVEKGLDVAVKVRNLSAKHMLICGENLIELAREENPVMVMQHIMENIFKKIGGKAPASPKKKLPKAPKK